MVICKMLIICATVPIKPLTICKLERWSVIADTFTGAFLVRAFDEKKVAQIPFLILPWKSNQEENLI